MFVGCCEDADEGDDVLFLAGNCRVEKRKTHKIVYYLTVDVCIYLIFISLFFSSFHFYLKQKVKIFMKETKKIDENFI